MHDQFHIAPTPAAWADAAAQDFANRCQRAIQQQGYFAACLSGGSTPTALFSRLVQPPYRSSIAWRHVMLFWTDERFAPLNHPDSNFNTAYSRLIRHVAIHPHHVHPMVTQGLQPQQAAIRYAHRLRCVFSRLGHSKPQFDLLYLGMGDDGHTASLFPDSPLLRNRAQQPWVGSVWVRHLQAYRMTLTPQAICSARAVTFLVSGAAKAKPLRDVLHGPRPSSALPAQMVWLQCQRRCSWLTDAAAARFMPPPRAAAAHEIQPCPNE